MPPEHRPSQDRGANPPKPAPDRAASHAHRPQRRKPVRPPDELPARRDGLQCQHRQPFVGNLFRLALQHLAASQGVHLPKPKPEPPSRLYHEPAPQPPLPAFSSTQRKPNRQRLAQEPVPERGKCQAGCRGLHRRGYSQLDDFRPPALLFPNGIPKPFPKPESDDRPDLPLHFRPKFPEPPRSRPRKSGRRQPERPIRGDRFSLGFPFLLHRHRPDTHRNRPEQQPSPTNRPVPGHQPQAEAQSIRNQLPENPYQRSARTNECPATPSGRRTRPAVQPPPAPRSAIGYQPQLHRKSGCSTQYHGHVRDPGHGLRPRHPAVDERRLPAQHAIPRKLPIVQPQETLPYPYRNRANRDAGPPFLQPAAKLPSSHPALSRFPARKNRKKPFPIAVGTRAAGQPLPREPRRHPNAIRRRSCPRETSGTSE